MQKKKQTVTVTVAAAKGISMDAAVVTVSAGLDGTFQLRRKKNRVNVNICRHICNIFLLHSKVVLAKSI